MGSDHFTKSKSPGLVKNVLAILEIIFDKSTVAEALDEAAPVAKKPKTARKDRHTAPGAGYGAEEVRAAENAGLNPTGTGDL